MYRKGVGALIVNDYGKVWVGQRIGSNHASWQMPQGGLEYGETPDKALMRELFEEIGTNNFELLKTSGRWLRYDIPEYIRSDCWNGRYLGQEQMWFLLKYLGNDVDINVYTEHQEFCGWKWIDHSELVDMAIEFKRQLYKDILEEFLPVIQSIRDVVK